MHPPKDYPMINSAGILTFHRVMNHGAVLQAYALQHSVEKLGVACEILDLQLPHCSLYETSGMNSAWQRLCWTHATKPANSLKRTVKSVVAKSTAYALTPSSRKRFRAFQEHYLQLSKAPFANPEALYNKPPSLDAFITGSDQVWNPQIGAGWSPEPFFLTFVPNGTPRIAYAPSFGTQHIEPQFRNQYAEWLRDMTHLSARETQGVDLIREICGKEANHVVDPTFLLSATEWQNLGNAPSISEPYIFCYSVGSDNELMKVCCTLKQRTGLPVYKICRPQHAILDLCNRNIHAVIQAGPREFLGYLNNASMIVTNSFHGTALAINMQKPFVVVQAAATTLHSRSSRITSLLRLLRLSERLICSAETAKEIKLDVDYRDANEVIARERSHSMNYLRDALELR
jgi:hypothetical protein